MDLWDRALLWCRGDSFWITRLRNIAIAVVGALLLFPFLKIVNLLQGAPATPARPPVVTQVGWKAMAPAPGQAKQADSAPPPPSVAPGSAAFTRQFSGQPESGQTRGKPAGR